MSRRIQQSIVVLFVFVLAAAVVAGTGAFSAITADRATAVDMTDDASSFLGMAPHSGPNGAYAQVDADGLVELRLTDGNQNVGSGIAGGTGVPGEATTLIEDVLNVTNQGTQPVTVWITEESDAVQFGTTTDGHGAIDEEANGFTLLPGQTMEVGVQIDTGGLAGEQRLLDAATVHAAASGAEVGDGGDDGPVDGPGLEPAFMVGAPLSGDVGKAYVLNSEVSGSVSLSNADATLRGEATQDTAGWTVAVAGDVNGDGETDYAVGTSRNDEAGSDAGAVYLVYGPVSGTLNLSNADVKLLGSHRVPDISFGLTTVGDVNAVGDVNGDGFDDIIVGDYFNDSETGAAYLVYGSASLSGTVNLTNADATFLGEAESDRAGLSVSGAGDVNGDGFDDFVIGAPGRDNIGNEDGAAYLVYGSVTLSGPMNLSDSDATFLGETPGDKAGGSVSGAGDVNNDGYDDIVVGAQSYDDGGAAYLIYGGSGTSAPSGTLNLASADVRLIGENPGEGAGSSVSGAGDVNGDGFDDILVGASQNNASGVNAGATYLVYGSTTLTGTINLTGADLTISGEEAHDSLGYAIAEAGDLNGDGYDDFVVAAPQISAFGPVGEGTVYLFYGGSLSGNVSASMADAILVGEAVGDGAGWSVDGGT